MVEPITMKTKSGTRVILAGDTKLTQEKKRALEHFIKVYNQSFTIDEQRIIGNVVYNYDKSATNHLDKDAYAATNFITSKSVVQKLNPGKSRMGAVTFSKESYNDDFSIIHEMIHVKKSMMGTPYNKQLTKSNEKKQDFETVARISKQGLKNHIGGLQKTINLEKRGKNIKKEIPIPVGYYFDNNVSNQSLIRSIPKKDQKKTLKLEEAQLNGLLQDRKLLTGSLNTNIVGKVASSRAEKLYPQSFFNKKFSKPNK